MYTLSNEKTDMKKMEMLKITFTKNENYDLIDVSQL